VNKKKREEKISVASEKYTTIENNTVLYSPETYYPVNFSAASPEYNLVTDSDVRITCSICLQFIHTTEDIIRCPSCDIAYHKNHLYEWVKMSGICPACKAKLRIT
jgi:Zn finger protein HypA/HybF involved in hydrogenase expression